jgi:hypothetical protein
MGNMDWYLIAVCFPALAPIALNAILLWRTPGDGIDESRKSWLAPIKDGQLHWLSVSFAASALYEMFHKPNIAAMGGLAAILIISGLSAAFLAALGGLYPTDIKNKEKQWLVRYGWIIWSALQMLGTGFAFYLVHFHP